MVRMEHGSLPPGQTIEVADASVRAYERMGWTVMHDRRPARGDIAAARSRRQTPKEGN